MDWTCNIDSWLWRSRLLTFVPYLMMTKRGRRILWRLQLEDPWWYAWFEGKTTSFIYLVLSYQLGEDCWELYFELILTNMKDEGLMETKEETCKERKRLQHIFYYSSLFLVTLVSLLYKEIQGICFTCLPQCKIRKTCV